ncbi:hypothetical protein [Stakelama tenebrarum]|uniref:Uncharacterized protein n=1 Tax=Stakelama tenebrarum TaxID=2711215 RepID=A0A6G6Y429_9SPHN|nr:hypothetical protein [Sphingosinithalassobacter tenebrarum]QIG79660.1 hypothetical protein G5C33_07555 [Sphingosinithalassobacter tenebrarum]
MPVRLVTPAADAFEAAGHFRHNRRLSVLARRVAGSAATLLAPDPRLLLGAARAGETLRLGWWSDRFELVARIDASREDFSPVGSGEGALQRSSAALIDWLAGRWPPEAAPATLGIITDGTGVAFAPERPDPFAPGWFGEMAGCRFALREIRPVAGTGPAALLTCRRTSSLIH